MSKHTAETAGAAMALPILDAAVATAYGAFCDLGLTSAAARDAILTHVSDTVTAHAYERDGVPVPVDVGDVLAGEDDNPAKEDDAPLPADEDDTGGGVRPR